MPKAGSLQIEIHQGNTYIISTSNRISRIATTQNFMSNWTRGASYASNPHSYGVSFSTSGSWVTKTKDAAVISNATIIATIMKAATPAYSEGIKFCSTIQWPGASAPGGFIDHIQTPATTIALNTNPRPCSSLGVIPLLSGLGSGISFVESKSKSGKSGIGGSRTVTGQCNGFCNSIRKSIFANR